MTTPTLLRSRLLPWVVAGALLLLPALAMQVTDAVAWGPEDFLAAALLLVLGLGTWEIASRLTRRPGRRALAALAIGALVLYVWAELAVGVFTSLGS